MVISISGCEQRLAVDDATIVDDSSDVIQG
jgi:hypothetical protein